jgi:hypothetical protein
MRGKGCHMASHITRHHRWFEVAWTSLTGWHPDCIIHSSVVRWGTQHFATSVPGQTNASETYSLSKCDEGMYLRPFANAVSKYSETYCSWIIRFPGSVVQFLWSLSESYFNYGSHIYCFPGSIVFFSDPQQEWWIEVSLYSVRMWCT